MRAGALLAAAALGAGCVRQEITINTLPLADRRAELRGGFDGTITLYDNAGETHVFRAADRVDVIATKGVHRQLSIAELSAGCDHSAWCGDGVDRVVIGHAHVMSDRGKSAVEQLLVLAAGGGLFYCGIACDSPANYLVPLGALALGVGALAVLALYGHGRSGLHP